MADAIYHLIPGAPKPVAPYSHVVEKDGWLFVTGQLATDPDDDSLPPPDGIEAQTHKVMDNLRRALEGAGSSFADILCVRGVPDGVRAGLRGLQRRLRNVFQRRSPASPHHRGRYRLGARRASSKST